MVLWLVSLETQFNWGNCSTAVMVVVRVVQPDLGRSVPLDGIAIFVLFLVILVNLIDQGFELQMVRVEKKMRY